MHVATASPRKILLSYVVDPAGNAVALTYDAQHRLVAIDDAVGLRTNISYESTDPFKITKVTDPFTRSAVFEYTAANQLARITDVINLSSSFGYGSGDFINRMTTPYGDTTFAYFDDGSYRLWLEATDVNNDTEHLEFRHLAPGIAASDPPETVPVGFTNNAFLDNRNTYFWDKRNWREHRYDYSKAYRIHWLHRQDMMAATSDIIESEKQPLENRVWYGYPRSDGVCATSIVTQDMALPCKLGRRLDDGTTQLYRYEYNSLGHVTQSIDPVGRTTKYIYAANKIDLLEVRQIDGVVEDVIARFTYNAQHKPLTHTDAAGQTTVYTYNAFGQLETVIDARGQGTVLTYDDRSFLSTVTGPIPSAVTSYTYDDHGRLQTVTDSQGYRLTSEYDDLDRLTTVTYPDATSQQIIYDRMDVQITVDRLGRRTERAYDALQRLTSLTDPLGRASSFTYCVCNALSEVIGPLAQFRATLNYDLQERLVSKVLADGRTYRYLYEASRSRVRRQTDPSGQATNFQYYLDDNIRSIGYSDSTPAVTYSYDPSFSRIIAMRDGSGVTRYSYHPAGTLGALRLKSEESDLATFQYTYDELGRRVSRDIDGMVSSREYDAMSRVVGEANALGSFSFDYLAATRKLARAVYPNGEILTFDYYPNEGDQRLRQITARFANFRYSYYFPTGNISSWTQTPAPGSADYHYDDADQLLEVLPDGPGFAYSYDMAGNRLTERTPSGSVRNFTYNSSNELTSIDSTLLSYDLNGNLLDDGIRTFQWDGANRLLGIIDGSRRTDFGYDGLDRRVRITERDGGSVTSDRALLWCGPDICEERDVSSSAVRKRFFDQGMQQDGQSYFYTKDHLGSIRVITDNVGTIAARYEYDPYGRSRRVEGFVESVFGYAGYYVHSGSGLNLTLYRAYDPSLGRWLSEDPIGFRSGWVNLYYYVGNNPLQFVDPMGLYGTDKCDYYDKRCKESGGKYYCEQAPFWCNFFPKPPDPDPTRDNDYEGWFRCTRQCLQDCDEVENRDQKMCPLTADDRAGPWDPRSRSFDCHQRCYRWCGLDPWFPRPNWPTTRPF